MIFSLPSESNEQALSGAEQMHYGQAIAASEDQGLRARALYDYQAGTSSN